MKNKKLSISETKLHLKELTDWKFLNNFIQKDFEFKDFLEAFGFIARLAVLSEKLNHHPNWSGVYNKVQIKLQTHDAGGITAKDIEMATKIEKLFDWNPKPIISLSSPHTKPSSRSATIVGVTFLGRIPCQSLKTLTVVNEKCCQ